MFFQALAVAAVMTGVSAQAQRPNTTSICDYYTTGLLMNNTAENQMSLLTLVVNTAVIGNYTKPNVGVAVPGILAAGTFNGVKVNLAPYFNGGLASTNRGGDVGRSVNFLDGGGAAPLKLNKAADDPKSNQYTLLTHLYEYFGALLGCSMMNTAGYPAYTASPSMGTVHKFMDLSPEEVGYFIQQVALSAASFGVAESDIAIVGKALNGLFNVRCAPPTVVIPTQPARLQSICMQDSCPLAPNDTCSAYPPVGKPAVANATLAGNSGSSNTTAGSAGSASSTSIATSSAGRVALGFGTVVVGGLFAMLL